jgi:hypothetical protein
MLARLAILALAAGLAAQPALACSCGCREQNAASTQRTIDRAAYVFSGKVISVSKEASGAPVFQIQLTRILKGAPAKIITLHTMAGSCGVSFREGEAVEVIAGRGKDGTIGTQSCALVCGSGVFDLLRKNGRPVP